jgi:NAD(P)-dependent dehydrogenase (short-subunit alcohol dehydrogenase family)
VVLITGAAGGMGALFVERFLQNGDRVVATDAPDRKLLALTDKLANAGLLAVSADVADEASCGRLASFARDRGNAWSAPAYG